MLELILPPERYWDEHSNQFIAFQGGTYHLEHSLKAIFEWEGVFHKPFLTYNIESANKTEAELIEYIRCMSLTPIDSLTATIIYSTKSNDIASYLKESQTATTIKKQAGQTSSEYLSAELLYYYIGQAQIPICCEMWHISRLFAILGIAGEKSKPPKKMGKAATMRSNAAINRARRAGRPG